MADEHAREETKAIVREALKEILDQRDALDRERHRADHDFVALLREERERRRIMWEKVRSTVIGGMILACFGGVARFLIWVADLFLKSKGHETGMGTGP